MRAADHATIHTVASPPERFPTIAPVEWLSARAVLGGEASDFTPWLQQPHVLEHLGSSLKLEDLTTVATEHNVLGKRLDILASAVDERGEEIPICIENQYGQTDADHLGRLIAYLAQQERGRAVWVVEDAHDAFVAAVRFLNRTSSDEAGYYLVQVRFTHGARTPFQVHFEVLAAPSAWERAGRRRTAGARPQNNIKIDYLGSILEAVRPELTRAGFNSMNTHSNGNYLWIRWPQGFWFRQYGSRLDIRVTKDLAVVALYVNVFESYEANAAAMEVLRVRYDSRLRAAIPAGSEVDWEILGSGNRKAVRVDLPGGGYETGEPEATASWAATVACAWLSLLTEEPIDDLESQMRIRLPAAMTSADLQASPDQE